MVEYSLSVEKKSTSGLNKNVNISRSNRPILMKFHILRLWEYLLTFYGKNITSNDTDDAIRGIIDNLTRNAKIGVKVGEKPNVFSPLIGRMYVLNKKVYISLSYIKLFFVKIALYYPFDKLIEKCYTKYPCNKIHKVACSAPSLT